jgi:hypothetical protein
MVRILNQPTDSSCLGLERSLVERYCLFLGWVVLLGVNRVLQRDGAPGA